MAPLTSLFKFTAYKSFVINNTRTVDIRKVLKKYSNVSNTEGLIYPFTPIMIEYKRYWLSYLDNIPQLLKYKNKHSMVSGFAETMLESLRATLLTLPRRIDFDYFREFVAYIENIIKLIKRQVNWIGDMMTMFLKPGEKINLKMFIPNLNLSRRYRLYNIYVDQLHKL